VQYIYLVIMKSWSKYRNKKKRQELLWSMLNVHWARRKATWYYMPAIAATVESLVTDIVTDVLIRLPIIAQRSKGTQSAHYFRRVVSLVTLYVNG